MFKFQSSLFFIFSVTNLPNISKRGAIYDRVIIERVHLPQQIHSFTRRAFSDDLRTRLRASRPSRCSPIWTNIITFFTRTWRSSTSKTSRWCPNSCWGSGLCEIMGAFRCWRVRQTYTRQARQDGKADKIQSWWYGLCDLDRTTRCSQDSSAIDVLPAAPRCHEDRPGITTNRDHVFCPQFVTPHP